MEGSTLKFQLEILRSELFEHDGARSAAAVADGGDAPLPGLLEGAGQVGGDAAAGGAERVAQADSAAVDIHLGGGAYLLNNNVFVKGVLCAPGPGLGWVDFDFCVPPY